MGHGTPVRENDKWKVTLEIPDWYLMQGIYYADRVETPMLLFQGEHDFPPIEAQMYAHVPFGRWHRS